MIEAAFAENTNAWLRARANIVLEKSFSGGISATFISLSRNMRTILVSLALNDYQVPTLGLLHFLGKCDLVGLSSK